MVTAVLTRPLPSVRLDRHGRPVPRVQATHAQAGDLDAKYAATLARIERVAEWEAWARIGIVAALSFTVGILTYDLAPFVGWASAFVDALTLTALTALAFPAGRALAPHVAHALHATRALDLSLSWWVGMTVPRRDAYLPPLPPHPLAGAVAIIPWHGALARDGVIVRRTRLARHVDWVLLYDHSHVVGVARVTGQVWDTPTAIARLYGPRTGLSARVYRDYTAGHRRACALTTDLTYRLARPVALDALGIRGPLGSHRYLGTVAR
jgi:predicted transcriptional regulator